ncbi:MAG: hypothetical protein H6Q41_5577 [Deltaproteobacteria bacterium]|nr:hypothetical protein [Deltaproteobacteria bacterium]
MIDLSVIIVNWNTRDLLVRCLNSITQVTQRMKAEIFVVDNRSSDESGRTVKERFSQVILIENETNLGFAGANNQALRRSKGNYLLLLNPDTQVKEEPIQKLISLMDAHPDVGITGVQLLNSDGSKQNSIANFPSLATELLNKSLLRWLSPGKFPGKEKDYPEPIEVDSVIGACTDWCYRMKRAGWKIYHVPDAEVYHFQGKSAEKEKKRARVEYFRSRYHFFKKNKGNLQWFILLAGVLIRLGCELFFASAINLFTFFSIRKWRKKLSVYAYLLWWHLKGCPKGMGLEPVQ